MSSDAKRRETKDRELKSNIFPVYNSQFFVWREKRRFNIEKTYYIKKKYPEKKYSLFSHGDKMSNFFPVTKNLFIYFRKFRSSFRLSLDLLITIYDTRVFLKFLSQFSLFNFGKFIYPKLSSYFNILCKLCLL